MGNVKIVFNTNDWRAFRRDPAMVAAVNNEAHRLGSEADALAQHKGAAYYVLPSQRTEYGQVALVTTGKTDGKKTHNRVRANMVDQAAHHTLQKALSKLAGGLA